MLSPSAAPRWKIATRTSCARGGRGGGQRAAEPERRAYPTPTIASAEFRRNTRRVIIDTYFLLELGRAEVEARKPARRIDLARPARGCPASASAKFMRASSPAVFIHSAPAVGVAGGLLFAIERLAELRHLVGQREGEIARRRRRRAPRSPPARTATSSSTR